MARRKDLIIIGSSKEKLIAAPKNHLELIADYKVKKFLFAVNLSAIKGLNRQVTPTVFNSSYILLNARTSYRMNKLLDLFIKAENITNQHYEINYEYPMPGILVLGGVNCRLQKIVK